MVKPILIYDVFVRWRSLAKARFAKQLDRIERTALIDISGALLVCTIPAMALNRYFDCISHFDCNLSHYSTILSKSRCGKHACKMSHKM